MGEYIEREAARAEIRKGKVVTYDAFGIGVIRGIEIALLRIEAIPTVDAVEVVRCKDCTEWDENECECSHWYGFRENDFCSYGERKEDG